MHPEHSTDSEPSDHSVGNLFITWDILNADISPSLNLVEGTDDFVKMHMSVFSSNGREFGRQTSFLP
jgi:hypothetical protein